MKTISAKSSSLISPSPLSSSRLMTMGVMLTCADIGKGALTALWLALFKPPHWISLIGSTFWKGSGGSVHVGAFPVPTHLPTSQAVYCGQSQSSSQGHAASPIPGSLHMLGKYDWLPHMNFTTSPPPFGVHSCSSS